MEVIARPFGKPGFDRRRLVGGVIIHDEVDVEIGRHGCVDSIEETAELGCAMAPVAAAEHLASAISRAANSAVVDRWTA